MSDDFTKQPGYRPLTSADFYRNVSWERYLPTPELQQAADAAREEQEQRWAQSYQGRTVLREQEVRRLAAEVAAQEGASTAQVLDRWRDVALQETYDAIPAGTVGKHWRSLEHQAAAQNRLPEIAQRESAATQSE